MPDVSIENLPIGDIFERQGMPATTSPDDVYFEEITYRDSATREVREWFAIPKEIVAYNPFDNSKEKGRLTEEGAFIGNSVRLGDPLHPSTFAARVMVLGKSSVRNFCKLGYSTVVDNSQLFNSRLGANVVVHSDTYLSGGDPFHTVHIGNDTVIGSNTSILYSRIGNETAIGDDVVIMCSAVGNDAHIESGDEVLPSSVAAYYSRKRPTTYIDRSKVSDGVKIESNSAVMSALIGEGAVIGSSSVIKNTDVQSGFTIGKESSMIEAAENASAPRGLLAG